MTGLNERGVSIRLARFLIELTAFVVGFVLGGAVGWGSVWAVWRSVWRCNGCCRGSTARPTVVGSPDATWQRDAMQTQMLIGGTWSDGTEQIVVHNPATGEQIAIVAGGGRPRPPLPSRPPIGRSARGRPRRRVFELRSCVPVGRH